MNSRCGGIKTHLPEKTNGVPKPYGDRCATIQHKYSRLNLIRQLINDYDYITLYCNKCNGMDNEREIAEAYEFMRCKRSDFHPDNERKVLIDLLTGQAEYMYQ